MYLNMLDQKWSDRYRHLIPFLVVLIGTQSFFPSRTNFLQKFFVLLQLLKRSICHIDRHMRPLLKNLFRPWIERIRTVHIPQKTDFPVGIQIRYTLPISNCPSNGTEIGCLPQRLGQCMYPTTRNKLSLELHCHRLDRIWYGGSFGSGSKEFSSSR